MQLDRFAAVWHEPSALDRRETLAVRRYHKPR
jgi:hypothetical protein